MHDHIRRLVDDGEVVVLIEDVKRNVFGDRALARRLDESEGDDGTRLEAKRRFSVLAVDVDPVFGLNRLAQENAAILGELSGEEKVEAPTGLGVGNDAFRDLAHLFRRHVPFDLRLVRFEFVKGFDFLLGIVVERFFGKIRRHLRRLLQW